MGQRVVTRDLPKLSFRASFDLATVDVDKRTVQVIWTTGARVLRGFWESFYEELSLDPKHVRMGRLQSGTAPLLNSHRSYDLEDVIGVIEDAQLDAKAKRGTATVRFDSGAKGEEVFRKVREGILRNTSVGYSTYKMLKIEDGDSTIPVYRAVDWEPAEISMVAIGADSGAVTRSAGGNPCEFIQERAMDPEETETDADETETTEECECEGEEDCDCDESADEEREAETESEPEPEPKRSAADLERFRILGIQRVGRALKRPADEINAAISKGMTLAKYRARAQDAYAKKETIMVDKRDARIQVGADARDKFMRCAEHLIYQRAGIADMMVAHAKARGETLVIDPGECRGLTMAELAREFLERGGVKTRGMDKMELVGKAFMQRTSGGMNATGDFTVLLENTLHKTLLAAYATTPDTWRRFCKVGTVNDFRPHPRYRQGSFGVLETVNEGGEFKSASIPDGEKQSISAGTKGRIVAITRQSIINDDMGAFNDIATRLGRAAALTIEVDVYALLVANPLMGDGLALFHATHGNIGAGGAAITVATIDADRVLMAQQQDPAKNEYLELRPAVLVLPVGLGGTARVINQAQYDVDAKVNARMQEPNRVVGLYRDIVDTARLAGTTRYSFADPSVAPVIEVAFLNGQQSPYMEMQQGWRVDGTEWKIRLDFGVGAIDWRGVVRNPGA